MAKEPENYYYEEEQGVSFFEFMGVLFGRKLLLLIVTASLFVASSLGIYLYNRSVSTYEATFSYSVKGLAEGKYIDGSRFDIRDLIKVDKLEQYQEEHEELKGLKMNDVYRNGIQSLTHEVTYLENKSGIDDGNLVVDKDFYKLVFKSNGLTFTQAQVLAEAIAKEANVISYEIVNTADYTQQLKFYASTNAYDLQMEYLETQYKLLDDKYNNLITEYGDVSIGNGLKVSDAQAQLKNHFGKNGFSDLKAELDLNGFTKKDELYKAQLEKRKESLEREKAVCENKRTALTDQVNALLAGASAGAIQSIEIEKYNEQLIELTNRICDLEEQIALLKIKIDNFGKEDVDEEYKAKLVAFETKLNNYYDILLKETKYFSDHEKSVVDQYSSVYFDSNSIVVKKSNVNVVLLMVIALASSFIVGLIVNLALDGKKLSASYRLNANSEEKEKSKEEGLNNR